MLHKQPGNENIKPFIGGKTVNPSSTLPGIWNFCHFHYDPGQLGFAAYKSCERFCYWNGKINIRWKNAFLDYGTPFGLFQHVINYNCLYTPLLFSPKRTNTLIFFVYIVCIRDIPGKVGKNTLFHGMQMWFLFQCFIMGWVIILKIWFSKFYESSYRTIITLFFIVCCGSINLLICQGIIMNSFLDMKVSIYSNPMLAVSLSVIFYYPQLLAWQLKLKNLNLDLFFHLLVVKFINYHVFAFPINNAINTIIGYNCPPIFFIAIGVLIPLLIERLLEK
jgi:hypothetical protein